MQWELYYSISNISLKIFWKFNFYRSVVLYLHEFRVGLCVVSFCIQNVRLNKELFKWIPQSLWLKDSAQIVDQSCHRSSLLVELLASCVQRSLRQMVSVAIFFCFKLNSISDCSFRKDGSRVYSSLQQVANHQNQSPCRGGRRWGRRTGDRSKMFKMRQW